MWAVIRPSQEPRLTLDDMVEFTSGPGLALQSALYISARQREWKKGEDRRDAPGPLACQFKAKEGKPYGRFVDCTARLSALPASELKERSGIWHKTEFRSNEYFYRQRLYVLFDFRTEPGEQPRHVRGVYGTVKEAKEAAKVLVSDYGYSAGVSEWSPPSHEQLLGQHQFVLGVTRAGEVRFSKDWRKASNYADSEAEEESESEEEEGEESEPEAEEGEESGRRPRGEAPSEAKRARV